MESVATVGEWNVVLDLGADPHATELDALYLEAVLVDAGIPVQFFPWHPHDDVLTPLGALRPLKLLVPETRLGEARVIAAELPSGEHERHDVVVPVADAWVLPYYVRVLVSHVLHRARERGGVWLVVLRGVQAYALLQVATMVYVLVTQVARTFF